jgi:hypothetical protein
MSKYATVKTKKKMGAKMSDRRVTCMMVLRV